MYKIGMIGESDSCAAFYALGIYTAPVENAEEAGRAVDRMAREGYGLIFITETLAGDIGETIERYRDMALPAIILIPGSSGSLGIGIGRIRQNVERAVGANILSKKEGR